MPDATLLDRLRTHLRQLPDHARQRETARLLAECLAVLEDLAEAAERPSLLDAPPPSVTPAR